MLQIIHCTHRSWRERGAPLCTSCEISNVLLRMEATIDRREPAPKSEAVLRNARQAGLPFTDLPLVSSAN